MSLQLGIHTPCCLIGKEDVTTLHRTKLIQYICYHHIIQLPYIAASRDQLLASTGMQTMINEYLIGAGDLKHLVYQLTFSQGLSNHFVNPRLDSEQSQTGMIYP